MERLTALDASFLEAEDSDPHVSLAVGGLSVLEGPAPDFDQFVSGISERIEAVPRFRQMLRTHLLDLQPPEWVNDPNVDLSHHIHRAALPQPGDDTALFRFAADVMERRLDRERPLWECWMVEGLAGGQWAILLKIHHSIADGIATMHMLAGLSDTGDGETFASEIRAARTAPRKPFSLPSLTLNPLKWATGMWNLATNVTSTAVTTIEGTIAVAGGILSPAAESSLVGPVTTMRRFCAASVSLGDVTKVKQTFDVTLNDVALAAITTSFRAALVRRGIEPRRNSLRTLVPVSVRSNDAMGVADNRVSVMLPFLPVDRDDPLDRLRTVKRRLTRAKASGQREAGSVFLAAVNLMPFSVTSRVVRTLTRLPQRGVVTLATNVPGPRQRMQIMGREVLRVFPIPPIALQLRTGVAIVSYVDELVFGITADFDATPDVEEIARGIEDAVAELVALC